MHAQLTGQASLHLEPCFPTPPTTAAAATVAKNKMPRLPVPEPCAGQPAYLTRRIPPTTPNSPPNPYPVPVTDPRRVVLPSPPLGLLLVTPPRLSSYTRPSPPYADAPSAHVPPPHRLIRPFLTPCLTSMLRSLHRLGDINISDHRPHTLISHDACTAHFSSKPSTHSWSCLSPSRTLLSTATSGSSSNSCQLLSSQLLGKLESRVESSSQHPLVLLDRDGVVDRQWPQQLLHAAEVGPEGLGRVPAAEVHDLLDRAALAT